MAANLPPPKKQKPQVTAEEGTSEDVPAPPLENIGEGAPEEETPETGGQDDAAVPEPEPVAEIPQPAVNATAAEQPKKRGRGRPRRESSLDIASPPKRGASGSMNQETEGTLGQFNVKIHKRRIREARILALRLNMTTPEFIEYAIDTMMREHDPGMVEDRMTLIKGKSE